MRVSQGGRAAFFKLNSFGSRRRVLVFTDLP